MQSHRGVEQATGQLRVSRAPAGVAILVGDRSHDRAAAGQLPAALDVATRADDARSAPPGGSGSAENARTARGKGERAGPKGASRGGQPPEERVHREHESRDSNAYERHPRYGRIGD